MSFSFEPPIILDFNWLPSEPVIIEKEGSQYDLAIRGWEDESGFRECPAVSVNAPKVHSNL